MAPEDTSPESEELEERTNSAPVIDGESETPETKLTDPAQEEVTEPNDDDDDPLEAYYIARRAREALDREDEEARIQRLVEEKLREQNREAIERQEKERLNAAYVDTVSGIVNSLRRKRFYNEDGEETRLSDEEIQEVVNHVNTMNSKQKDVIGAALGDRLAEEALARLPGDARTQFEKEAAELGIGEWLIKFAEYYAPKTKHAQKLEADREVAIKAAEARGRKQGQSDPPGTPPTGTEKHAPPKPAEQYNFNSSYDRARALNNGDISDEEFRKLERKARSGL